MSLSMDVLLNQWHSNRLKPKRNRTYVQSLIKEIHLIVNNLNHTPYQKETNDVQRTLSFYFYVFVEINL